MKAGPSAQSSESENPDDHIFELEAKAADSEMIASLSDDEATRLRNRSLASQLRQHANRLRRRRDTIAASTRWM
jgi:hypothetical protein